MMDSIIGGMFVLVGIGLQFCLSVWQRRIDQNQKRLRLNFRDASKDIEFLLEVEDLLLDELKKQGIPVTKNHIRQLVKESGLDWTGRFTPGRNKERLRRMKLDED